MAAPAEQPSVLTFVAARQLVEEHAAQVSAKQTEPVHLLDAVGRVLAETVSADRDMPPFPRSTRDGYAVRSADLAVLPAKLEVIGEVKAGETSSSIPAEVRSGQAVSIMTGAPVPHGSNAVVMVEHTSPNGAFVKVHRGVGAGENVVPQGAEAQQGATLLEPGQRLNDAAIALAASVGREKLNVYRKPRVAVIATGDEIVDVNAIPGPTQIRNSNSYSLAAQIRNAGGKPMLFPIAPDESGRLRQLIEEGLRADLLLLTGGVSMGRYDLVEHVLSEMKAGFFFTGAQIQPGRPVVFGHVPCGESTSAQKATYFFGLPGNPVSTMVTFELFVRPMLEALSGQLPHQLMFLHAKLKADIRVKTGLTRFLPAILAGEIDGAEVQSVPWQGSGDIAATARANCYVVVPPDRELLAAGEWVAVMMR